MQTTLEFAKVFDCDILRGSIASNYVVEEIVANRTLTADDVGKVFSVGTDALVITLPLAVVGMKYTFVNIGASANNIITVSPDALDSMNGTITLEATVVDLGGVVDKDLILTKTTGLLGDNAMIYCANLTEWTLGYSTGIWAAEA